VKVATRNLIAAGEKRALLGLVQAIGIPLGARGRADLGLPQMPIAWPANGDIARANDGIGPGLPSRFVRGADG
jgi:hypothetical protein